MVWGAGFQATYIFFFQETKNSAHAVRQNINCKMRGRQDNLKTY